MGSKPGNGDDFKKAVILATFCRSVTDKIASENVNDRIALGNYFCARLATERNDALVITGFDEDGAILTENVIFCKPLSDPDKAERRLNAILPEELCPYYAVARKEPYLGALTEQEKKEECDVLFKALWKRNSILEEYVTVHNFEFSLLSGKAKKRFPRYDRNTVYIDVPDEN